MTSPQEPPQLPWPVREITDPRELRALAHPVRFALLDLLAEGPLTASQCAQRLGESPANCSYHLRQLARYGHVRPAPGGRGRERPWQAREEGITWDEESPAAATAAAALDEAVDRYRFEAWRRFRARRRHESPEWRRASLSTDVVAWLTADELERLTQGIYDLFAPYEHRDRDAADRPAGARAVRFFAYAYPGAEGGTEVAVPRVGDPRADAPMDPEGHG